MQRCKTDGGDSVKKNTKLDRLQFIWLRGGDFQKNNCSITAVYSLTHLGGDSIEIIKHLQTGFQS
ncbi:hypothetical protein CP500_007940 [Tychonema bourrellyi FEM_GT703]|uniref:Uncharacterized protein n=1 Tax=Tychonema bourrellyi FEM_GT703 TaxID=2040638 RepID=A0A2G4F2J5_9CYAN|nr:hypothetical protein CP500_007940 [Tychonema bourrellyi FEM_GT703]